MNKIVQLFVCSITVAVLAGCTQPPSADDGKKVLEDWLDLPVLAHGEFRLVSFSKINSQKGQIQNAEGVTVQSYSLEYLGEIEALKRCALIDQANLAAFGKGKIYVIEESNPDFELFTNTIVNAGQRLTINGTIVFEKTEKGWKENKVVNSVLVAHN